MSYVVKAIIHINLIIVNGYCYIGRISSTSKYILRSVTTDFKDDKKSIFIFGLGYVGLRLAEQLLSKDWRVSGTCTNFQKSQTLHLKGVQSYIFDSQNGAMIQDDATEALLSANYLLSTIPPDRESGIDSVLRFHGQDLLRAAVTRNLKWIGYLSSTGVYGDRRGAWTSERDPVRPENPKTQARANAEGNWLNLRERSGLPVHIFRLAGIYGPGSSALDAVAKANGIIQEIGGLDDRTFISRIHVEDICRVLKASMHLSELQRKEDPLSGRGEELNPSLVNVSDDCPATRYEVLAYCCRLLGYDAPVPEADLTSVDKRESSPRVGGWTSRGGSKRVDNTLMHQLLSRAGLDSGSEPAGGLLYPNFREGLKSILSSDPSLQAIAAANSRTSESVTSDRVTTVSPDPSQTVGGPALTENQLAELLSRVQRLEARNDSLEREVAELKAMTKQRKEEEDKL